MSSPKVRRQRPTSPQAAPAPVSETPPPRPEILRMDASHLVWRARQRPAPGAPRRPITWDIRDDGKTLALRADLDREAEMREVDFREVHCRLNDVILTEAQIRSCDSSHTRRLRQSLQWQRNLAAHDPHFTPCYYDEEFGCWLFAASMACRDPDKADPLDLPVLRPATNEIMADRREERLWIAYRSRLRRWAESLSASTPACGPMRHQICRARIFHFWPIRDVPRAVHLRSRHSLLSSERRAWCRSWTIRPSEHWLETATRLARLPRREWMERLGLPPTRQTNRPPVRPPRTLPGGHRTAAHPPGVRRSRGPPASLRHHHPHPGLPAPLFPSSNRCHCAGR